ncbi:hypothetical protein [Bifidobacterium sp. SO1]|uniref:hypothetical protein n=1 Tax=Bifidobacterium sp. SO1 TaxID=2809029 RepID=UPI001BDC6BCF|nr:hypothetical protein [Bifidobacterium sp. SO1]MBT1162925.1 hypothetical protein [Bifidobacterium sp. SO1]
MNGTNDMRMLAAMMADRTPTVGIPCGVGRRSAPAPYPDRPMEGEWFIPYTGLPNGLPRLMAGFLAGLGMAPLLTGFPSWRAGLWMIACWLSALVAGSLLSHACRPPLHDLIEDGWAIRIIRLDRDHPLSDAYTIRWNEEGSILTGRVLARDGRIWLFDRNGRPIHARP